MICEEALKKGGFKSRIVLQVHDELLLEVPVEEQEEITKLLKEKMMSAADLKVPLAVSIESGNSWYETK